MNAKELLERYQNGQLNDDDLFIHRVTVERALSLLAAAESSDGPTTETDAEAYDDDNPYGVNLQVVPADFARRLERERNGLAARVVELEEELTKFMERT